MVSRATVPSLSSFLTSRRKPGVIFLLLFSLFLATLLDACGGGPPEAEFSASATSGQAPLSVSFTNKSKNFDEFQWDFGDGTTSTSRSKEGLVIHEYTKVGTHTVTLVAIKAGEPPETTTATLTITVEPGLLYHVIIDSVAPMAEVTKEQQFVVTGLDQFDNPIPGLT